MTPALDTSGLRLLLVEDNPGDVELVEEHLADVAGGTPRLEVAGSLADALDALAGDSFDAVLLDLNLPDSGGLETLDAALDPAGAVPVVVLTGIADREMGARAVARGAQDFLPKDQITGPLLVRSLRYAIERRRGEHRLLEAQKMEAVGRLAGGIAHDFNNLLTVIRSQSDLLLAELEGSGAVEDELEVIRDAAGRAAQLTGQLLAFGREQVLRPRIVDVNRVVSDMQDLLTRILGEDVRIVTELARDLPPIRVDPGQLEQVVMNLAVNARDAMPEGGTLRLATRLVPTREEPEGPAGEPGPLAAPQVCLEVADTGVGMDKEVVARMFEPFFTTKKEREGTGLGLAMSYGVVRQSGGSIHVKSEPGAGTSIMLRFPGVEGEPQNVDVAAPIDLGGVEMEGTILLVEDDPGVRRVARRVLERAGLEVRAVGDAESGLRLLEEGLGVDLVLTDMLLPGMTGGELAGRIREAFPDVPVVVMSGYAEGSPGRNVDLPPEITFVQKPFSTEGLVETIRDLLTPR